MTRWKYNFERWITQLVCRWRVQPTVWINANCRTLWASTSWTHIAVIGNPVTTSVWVSAFHLSSHLLVMGFVGRLEHCIYSSEEGTIVKWYFIRLNVSWQMLRQAQSDEPCGHLWCGYFKRFGQVRHKMWVMVMIAFGLHYNWAPSLGHGSVFATLRALKCAKKERDLGAVLKERMTVIPASLT